MLQFTFINLHLSINSHFLFTEMVNDKFVNNLANGKWQMANEATLGGQRG